jgi:hypothetical protein
MQIVRLGINLTITMRCVAPEKPLGCMLQVLIFIYICPRFGGVPPRSGKTLKRESGANPEQTRCCKLHKNVFKHTAYPLFHKEWEGGLKKE